MTKKSFLAALGACVAAPFLPVVKSRTRGAAIEKCRLRMSRYTPEQREFLRQTILARMKADGWTSDFVVVLDDKGSRHEWFHGYELKA